MSVPTGSSTASWLGPNHMQHVGEYTFTLYRPRLKSTLVEPEMAYYQLVEACDAVAASFDDVRVSEDDDTTAITIKVFPVNSGAEAFQATMQVINSSQVTELGIDYTCRPQSIDLPLGAILHRLDLPFLRRLRIPWPYERFFLREIVLDSAASFFTLWYHMVEIHALIELNEGISSLCLRGRSKGCQTRCVCWSHIHVLQQHRLYPSIRDLLASRRQRERSIQAKALGILAVGYLSHPGTISSSRPTLADLPLEVVELVVDYACAEDFNHAQTKRLKELAFDPSHLATRAKSLKDLEGDAFSDALEEWMSAEGLVYNPCVPGERGVPAGPSTGEKGVSLEAHGGIGPQSMSM
ncbi:uncharacterized protein LOC62_04G005438 [Vanrija pseudolonga]|uniref:Uncharacterized protein n=1 Tax=Vanrija pseudolonga TaxID=143232 RepID=A0AAF1BI61_9TREE|nr:hypothetical protein LOC62_04G005438 [Vanrija pseudolonga]